MLLFSVWKQASCLNDAQLWLDSRSSFLIPSFQSFSGFAKTLSTELLQWHFFSSQRSVSHIPETDFYQSFTWFISPIFHCEYPCLFVLSPFLGNFLYYPDASFIYPSYPSFWIKCWVGWIPVGCPCISSPNTLLSSLSSASILWPLSKAPTGCLNGWLGICTFACISELHATRHMHWKVSVACSCCVRKAQCCSEPCPQHWPKPLKQ